jgi:hypothetical protein
LSSFGGFVWPGLATGDDDVPPEEVVEEVVIDVVKKSSVTQPPITAPCSIYRAVGAVEQLRDEKLGIPSTSHTI